MSTVEPPAGVPDVLQRIVADRRRRLARHLERPRGEPAAARLGPEENRFLAALAARAPGALIAEVKMGSPRLGSLHGRVDPLAQARLYGERGAAALSVVVEPDHFFGGYELLAECKRASGLPALAKDFVVSAHQLRCAAQSGADAVLLIAALYGAAELRRWAACARALGLAPLVETHGEADLAKLAGARWELVGVNNRDLRTFDVDLEHSIGLLPRLPAGSMRVAESGIRGAEDRRRLVAAGFDALLVGESLLLADDPGAKLDELLG